MNGDEDDGWMDGWLPGSRTGSWSGRRTEHKSVDLLHTSPCMPQGLLYYECDSSTRGGHRVGGRVTANMLQVEDPEHTYPPAKRMTELVGEKL